MSIGSATYDGRAAFRYVDFRLFCGSRFLGGLALQMHNVAVGWLVYDLTRSAWALGLIGLTAFAPAILFALVTGQTADSFDRRRITAAAHALCGIASFGLFANVWLGYNAVWPIYVLTFFIGTARAFGNPASQALLPTLVPREDFANAVAWNSSIWQSSIALGPALGGFLYALGATVVFGLATLAFATASILIVFVKQRSAKRPATKVTLATLTAGLGFIYSQPVLFGAISLDLVAVLLGGAVALLPIYAHEILHVGPWGLGLLRSMPALGAIVSGFVLAYRPLARKSGLRMLQAVALFGFATIGFGLSTDLYLSLACLFLAGVGDMVSVFVRQTLVQLGTPDEMRGRVAAVNTIFIGASNELGEFRAGSLAAMAGAVPAVVMGGIATVLVAMAWGRLFPPLRDRDKLIS